MRVKHFLSVLLFIAIAEISSSDTLEELIGPGRAAELAVSNPITELQYKDPQPRLIPRNEELRRLINDAMHTLEPTLFVESLYRHQKPAKSNAAASEPWNPAERNALYNATLGLSTLAGIKYYSVSRRGMRTFYEISTCIDGPDTKHPLPDPAYIAPPAELTIYARQKDLTFGDNVYKYTYYARPGSLIFVQENLTVMTLGGIITAVGKNNLRSVVCVLDAGDSLLVYVASMAKAASLPGLNERAGKSFSNRAAAILSWFTTRADTALNAIP
ncbi:hypothetical protein AGMMS4952_16890 [Spirochaetia bacterium]|nr:hypothetical protein AGMMS4952_16890 [Spirochaetia bacterium]